MFQAAQEGVGGADARLIEEVPAKAPVAEESEIAAGWDGKKVLIIAHSANRWALEHLLYGTPLEDLVDVPFNWREGWLFCLS